MDAHQLHAERFAVRVGARPVLHVRHGRSEFGEVKLGTERHGEGQVTRRPSSRHQSALPRLVVAQDTRVVFPYGDTLSTKWK